MQISSTVSHMGAAKRVMEALRDRLASKRGAWLVAAVAVLMILPTLNAGMLGDDFLFHEILSGQRLVSHPGSLFGLYTFTDGLPEHNQALQEQGLVPWWVTGHARMMFWRPLSELTHALDHTLWPQTPWLAHLHTVAWYGLLVWLLARLYAVLDPSPLRAHFSALVFAVAPTHLLAVVWIAARNQLIAACFIVLCIMAHHRWRQKGATRDRLMAFALFAMALASAEAGVAAAAYLVAYALCMEQGKGWRERAFSVLPYLVLVVAWRHQYDLWGYGTSGLGGYIDPGRDPLRFLRAVCLRLPALLLAGTAGVSSTLLNAVPLHVKPLYAGAAVLALLAMFAVTRSLGLWRSAVLRFLGVGAVLSLVPVCAAEANDRLLLNAEIGLSALLGALIARLADLSRDDWQRAGQIAARRLAQGLTAVHLVVFPLITVVVTLTVGRVTAVASYDEPMSLPHVPAASGAHVILLDAPNALFAGYFPASRRYHGVESGKSLHALASANQVLTMKVVDPYTLVLQGSKGFGDEVSRDLVANPFEVGESTNAGPFVAKVTHVNAEGLADEVRFRFKYRLDDPTLQFYRWTDDGYVAYAMPAVGASDRFGPGGVKKMVSRRLTAGL